MTPAARAGLLAALLGAAGPAQAKPLIVDSFDDQTPENNLTGSGSVWGDTTDDSVGCRMSFEAEDREGGTGFALRLEYDLVSDRQTVFVPTNNSVANPAQVRDEVFNGYYSVFGPKDLTGYKFVNLWARGDPAQGYTRSFRFELKDGSSAAGVTVNGLTDRWQRFSFPLARFKEVRDWTAAKEFAVVFGPAYVTRREGAIYIDDVYFSESADEKPRVPERVRRAPRASPAVDGKLDDWPEKAFTDLSAAADFLESGEISHPSDLSAWFSAAWDDERLYLAVDVQDDEIANGQTPENIWKEDSVEIYLDPFDRGFRWGDPRHFQLGFSPASAAGGPERWAWFQKRAPTTDEVRSAVKVYRDGYHVEAGIAWVFLGVEAPAPGKVLGFSVAVHDTDARGGTPEAKLNWRFDSSDGTIRLGRLVLQ